MIKGQNQTDARDFNMKAIVSYLHDRPMSCSELAEKTGLSKPALTKITAEMLELGLLMVAEHTDEKKEFALGRKPVYFSVNPMFGLVAAVDFSTVKITIRLSNMCGGLVVEQLIEDSEFITYKVLNHVIAELKNLYSTFAQKGQKLLSVCLAASGMLSRNGTIVQSPKFTECVGMNLQEYFQKEFNAKIIVKNDINLLLFAEQNRETAKKKVVIMLYIDSGIGGAIGIDHKIIEGEEGFAGEFGLMTFKVNGKQVELDNLSSINAIKKTIKERIAAGENCCLNGKFRFKDVSAAFLQGDSLVQDVINNSTEYVTQFIGNMFRILDCRNFLIAGRVRQLGEAYLQMIQQKLAETGKVKVAFNALAEEAIITGAISTAIESGINQVIASR